MVCMAAEFPAEVYERYLVPGILGPWTPDLIALAALQPGERVLDVACGTGLVGRLAVQRVGSGGKVFGLDINPDMLAVAAPCRKKQAYPLNGLGVVRPHCRL